MSEPNIDVQIGSIVSGKSRQGMVTFTINGHEMILDLPKAREIIGMLQGAVEAAISDELLFRFLTTKVGLAPDAATMALRDFRVMRQGSAETVYPN